MQGLPQPGDVLDGTYEVRSLLGKGGFGAVYLARQINMDRDVALKVLVAAGPKFEEMVKRFRREVMSIRNLTHPNTIRLYDFRDDPQGLLYYTMEALKGQNLKEVVAETGPVSPRRTKHILRQICKSLSEAHAHGIVHRDLKPANIMVVEMHGETDFVKVLDFGIAKVIGDAESEDGEQLTSAGILVGTLRYMSPEQITGEGIGPATDLYALGLITVEMLSGQSVFAGSGRWEVLHKQVSEEPIHVPESVRKSALGPLLELMLQKRVEDRIGTAAQVIAALEAIPDAELSDAPLVDGVPRTMGTATSGVSEVSGPARVSPSVPSAQTPVSGPRPQMDSFEGMKTEISAPMPRPTLAVAKVEDDFADAATAMIASPLEPRPQSPARAQNSPFGASTPSPIPSSDTASIRIGDGAVLSSDQEEKKKGAPVAMIGLAVLFVIVAVGLAATFMSGSSGEDQGGLEEDGFPSPAIAVEAPQGTPVAGEETEEAAEAEAEAEADPVWVRVETGEIRARVIRDGEGIGRTPMEIPVRGSTQVRLEADGYEPFTLDLDEDSEPAMAITLTAMETAPEAAQAPVERAPVERAPVERAPVERAPVKKATAEPSASRGTTSTTRTGTTTQPAQGGGGWVDLDSSKKKTAPSGGDGWVEVPTSSKKTETKEAVEIPVF